MSFDPRIDAYIDRQADFARPILERLRAAVHAACPDCEETLKWSMPAFLYKGAILATMAGFKRHAAFGFWQGEKVTGAKPAEGMGSFGRLTGEADLPAPAALQALIEKAVALVDAGATRPAKRAPRPETGTPPELAAALAASPAARAQYDAFPPGARRDYDEWIAEAKRPETREKRAAQAAEWLAEGKRRNWKYEGTGR
ncbi:MAG: YdeI/OmpD-associated family protein [Allosphingosinicella sp.]